jgi:hypothetical protein
VVVVLLVHRTSYDLHLSEVEGQGQGQSAAMYGSVESMCSEPESGRPYPYPPPAYAPAQHQAQAQHQHQPCGDGGREGLLAAAWDRAPVEQHQHQHQQAYPCPCPQPQLYDSRLGLGLALSKASHVSTPRLEAPRITALRPQMPLPMCEGGGSGSQPGSHGSYSYRQAVAQWRQRFLS